MCKCEVFVILHNIFKYVITKRISIQVQHIYNYVNITTIIQKKIHTTHQGHFGKNTKQHSKKNTP